jgi:hypothetical protein
LGLVLFGNCIAINASISSQPVPLLSLSGVSIIERIDLGYASNLIDVLIKLIAISN